jgi:hypothetical protein
VQSRNLTKVPSQEKNEVKRERENKKGNKKEKTKLTE